MKLYKSKEWLIEQYVNKKKSTIQIAKECGCSRVTIHDWLVKHNISRRSRSEARHLAQVNHCKLTSELLERIKGQLLGDAGLYSRNQYSAYLSWNLQHKEFAQYIKDAIAEHGMKSGNIRYNKKTDNYCFYTYFYKELLPLRDKWYFYNEELGRNQKKVPRDIKLTKTVCLHWYLGDGGLNNYKNRRSWIKLSTNDFPPEDVEFLVEKLNEKFRVSRHNNNTIYMSRESVEAFLNYTGPCPVICYKNRWNYQDHRKIPGVSLTDPTPRPVMQYDLDEKLIKVFESSHKAKRKTGIHQGNIVQVCKGKYKTAGGFIWRYT